MIRTILVITFIVIFLILSLPMMLVCKLMHKRHPEKSDRLSLSVVQFALKGILFLAGTKLVVLGEENVPTDRAVMYVGNHSSFFDIVITYARVPALTGFVSKLSMQKVPIINLWMKRLHCLFLDRDNIKEGLKTILAAIDKVKHGISIFIFPEGTRNRTPDTLMEFKGGSFKIAEKSGCPIVPVTLVNASDILEAHYPFIKKTLVVVEYGTPIDMKELSPEDKKHIGTYVQGIIAETYKKNKEMYFHA